MRNGDVVERLRMQGMDTDMQDTAREAADEVERLRERIEELKPYEVVSGDTWKARVSYEQLMEQTAQIKLLTHTIDTLNARIKGLQAKIKGYETPSADIPICVGTKSSPESEGVNG
jgi:archaellum component FlaC